MLSSLSLSLSLSLSPFDADFFFYHKSIVVVVVIILFSTEMTKKKKTTTTTTTTSVLSKTSFGVALTPLLLLFVAALLLLCSGGGGGGGGGGGHTLWCANALKSSSSSSSSSKWQGNAATKNPSDFEPFNQRRDHDVAEMAFATFSSGESAKAEARYGCLRDVYATNAGYSSINDNWRHRFKAGETTTEEERVSKTRGHRVSGDDVETVRIYYEGGARTYKTLLDAHFQMLEPEPWVVRRGRGDSKMYAHAIHPHTEEQLEAATQMLKEKHEKRVGPRGERVATKIVQNLRKDDGAFNFRVAEREKQKSQLTTRVELQTTQSKWNTEEYFKNDEWLYNSTEAMFVNSYLAGACSQNDHDGFKKPHDDVEHTLKAFEMGLERLESLGLVHLHPDVVMVPPLGGKKQLEKDREEMRKRQDRIKRGLSEFEDEFTTEEEEKKNHHHEEL